jgi:hypothetical protein
MSTYDKLFDILITVRDTREHFKCYSANDLKKLLASKKKKALDKLYILESMITDLRESLIIENEGALTSLLCPPAVD